MEEPMARNTRERTYRGIFVTPTGEYIGLDFYAGNLGEARDHAAQVASDVHMHVDYPVLTVVRVITCDADEFRAGDAGSWFPLF
jgi:hypothetical protein